MKKADAQVRIRPIGLDRDDPPGRSAGADEDVANLRQGFSFLRLLLHGSRFWLGLLENVVGPLEDFNAVRQSTDARAEVGQYVA